MADFLFTVEQRPKRHFCLSWGVTPKFRLCRRNVVPTQTCMFSLSKLQFIGENNNNNHKRLNFDRVLARQLVSAWALMIIIMNNHNNYNRALSPAIVIKTGLEFLEPISYQSYDDSGGSRQYFGCSSAVNQYWLVNNSHPGPNFINAPNSNLRCNIHRVMTLYKQSHGWLRELDTEEKPLRSRVITEHTKIVSCLECNRYNKKLFYCILLFM